MKDCLEMFWKLQVNHSFEHFCKNRQHGDRPEDSFVQNAVVLVEWSGLAMLPGIRDLWSCDDGVS